MRALTLGIVAGLLLAACGGDRPPKAGFHGLFRTPVGAELILSQDGEVVSLTIDGDTATGRLVGPQRVEGTFANQEGSLSFVLTLEGDRLRTRFDVRMGGREEVVEATYQRVASAPSGPGERAAALVGHWRHTEVLGSGEFHNVTDSHLVLEGDGRFSLWSKSAGLGSASESPRTGGTWKTDGGLLYLQADGSPGWEAIGRFQVSGNALMLTNASGGKQVFERT